MIWEFSERQKATRKLKQLQKQVAADSSPSESLQNNLHATEVDLNYIIYYPKGEKYISLFKDPGEQTKVLEKRDMIRKDVEQQMLRGTLGRGAAANPTGVDGGEEIAEKGKPERTKQDEKKRKKDGEVKNKKRKEGSEIAPTVEDADDDDEFFNF